ncbi:archaellum operon transcriptional activator EarA family protein [Methanocella arvoryzae]|nr:archaellum operon transcriptional activator EarA family protein [Methanocella arvoryzae]
MIDESKKTTKRKVLELLDSTSRPKDDAEIIAAVAIDEKELRQIIKAINNEHYTYEESLLGMGLVKEWKRLFREPGFTITDKGRYVLLYIRKKELEEML